ncbi:MAG: hypothetical protein V7L23_28925 [Nostoc sp.]|uniref:hypothetical protein n=1 Tax=Nostoc sp. TaxID=1180 RepID=UPI002FF3FBA8
MLNSTILRTNFEIFKVAKAIAQSFNATDRQINQLVYELYGLSDDEIAIVEGA